MHGEMKMGLGGSNDSVNTTGDIHGYEGFLGRLVYQGAPTTFSITSMGPFPTSSSANKNKFHFTKVDKQDIHREIVLLCRAKGYRHSQTNPTTDTPDILLGPNYVAENLHASSFSLSEGAGSDPAVSGEYGYNASGGRGLYDGANQYSYKYKYRVIWIDVAILRVKNIGGSIIGRTGPYETNFLITTDTGLSQSLNAGAYYTSGGSSSSLEVYSFTISPEYTSAIPFCDIENCITINNSLKIATVQYLSPLHQATISFSANPTGTSADFKFINPGPPPRAFGHKLAFQPTLPSGSKAAVGANNSFATSTTKIPWQSAMGHTENQYRLNGDLYLYVDPYTVPFPGNYISNIYVHITRSN